MILEVAQTYAQGEVPQNFDALLNFDQGVAWKPSLPYWHVAGRDIALGVTHMPSSSSL